MVDIKIAASSLRVRGVCEEDIYVLKTIRFLFVIVDSDQPRTLVNCHAMEICSNNLIVNGQPASYLLLEISIS